MTNEEAIECIKNNICYKQDVCSDGICKGTNDRPCAIDIAIECIEKQTPKEAKCGVSGNGWYGWIEFTCPSCGKKFSDTLVCPSCYQRVKPLKESDEE